MTIINFNMTDNMKQWFNMMIDEEIDDHEVSSINEHIFALGGDSETSLIHEKNAKEHRDYAIFLNNLKNNI